MGTIESAQSKEPQDPWWQTKDPQQHVNENVPKQTVTAQGTSEVIASEAPDLGEEAWLKEIQDLGKVIQHLASKNMKLLVLNRELRCNCDQQSEEIKKHVCEKKQTRNDIDRLDFTSRLQQDTDTSASCQLQTTNELDVAAGGIDIKVLEQQIGYEYQNIIDKLRKESLEKDETVKTLQYLLQSSNEQQTKQENDVGKMNEKLEVLKHEYGLLQDENKMLHEQLSLEREERQKVHEENEKLLKELQILKCRIPPESTASVSCDEAAEKSSAEFSCIPSDVSNDEQRKPLSSKAAAELDLFHKQLKAKREARHKALSAISAEMERLRGELNTERETRKSIAKELENVKNMTDKQHVSAEVDHLKSKLILEREDKERISKQLVQIQKQGNEEIENILKQLEKEKKKSEYVLEENKFMKGQLEESDQMLQQKSEENTQLQDKIETQKEKYQEQVSALKEVVTICKQLLSVRERQVFHLKETLENVEASVAQKNHSSLAVGLKEEYETQMENIKTLKTLYEERTRIMSAEKEKLMEQQKELMEAVESERKKSEALEVKLQETETVISERNETVSNLQDQLSDSLDQSKNLSHELTLINNMFTQILGSNDMDLDRLTKLLQENHDLITEITTKGESSEITASLPKLLLDLISNVEDADGISSKEEAIRAESTAEKDSVSAQADESSAAAIAESGAVSNVSGVTLGMQDISSNLPKVWRVLLELISHHVEPTSLDFPPEESKSCCYKSVETPYGPKNVISVSKTFLRIRDLILHKRSLQKEVTRLKQLNVHLETKLNDQERRLSVVSTELRKTWNVVDHMRVQHQQLHTHEKVLRYELQQKRKLLQELKEELEYCREKWEDARQKNCQTEVDWLKLRKEFAARKTKIQSSLNDSEESGYSEEKDDDNSSDSEAACKSPDNLVELAEGSLVKRDEKGAMKDCTSSASLPDLVSATADLTFPEPIVPSPPVPVSRNLENDTDHQFTPVVPGTSSHLPNDVTNQQPSGIEECTTVSLITLLKQQLSCFSRNLDIITAGLDNAENFRALQSIFTLPAIQIPDHLHPSNDRPCTSRVSIAINTESLQDRSVQLSAECDTESNYTGASNCVLKGVQSQSQGDGQGNTNFLDNCDQSTDDMTRKSTFNPARTSSCSDIPQSSVTLSENQSSSEESRGDVGEMLPQGLTGGNTDGKQVQESRTERLKRLEKQCQELFQKVTQPSVQGNSASSSTAQMEENATARPSDSSRSLEDMLDARAARLKRLEEQSQQLFKKVTRTTHRSAELSNRLEELHEHYSTDESGISSGDSQSESTSLSHRTTSPTIHNKTCLPNDTEHPEDPSPSCSNHIPQPPPLPLACCSQQPTATQNCRSSTQSLEAILDARADRLKRLEEQSQQLIKRVTRTTRRSTVLSNRLEELHEHYGSDDSSAGSEAAAQNSTDTSPGQVPIPPPLPKILRGCRLPTAELVQETEQDASASSSQLTTSSHIPSPPPLPSVLPPIRIPTEEESSHTQESNYEER